MIFSVETGYVTNGILGPSDSTRRDNTLLKFLEWYLVCKVFRGRSLTERSPQTFTIRLCPRSLTGQMCTSFAFEARSKNDGGRPLRSAFVFCATHLARKPKIES